MKGEMTETPGASEIEMKRGQKVGTIASETEEIAVPFCNMLRQLTAHFACQVKRQVARPKSANRLVEKRYQDELYSIGFAKYEYNTEVFPIPNPKPKSPCPLLVSRSAGSSASGRRCRCITRSNLSRLNRCFACTNIWPSQRRR